MLISLDWIKDFTVIPDLSPKEIGEKFTLTTAEVEGVQETGAGLNLIRVAEIISFVPHPEADKLNLVTFNLGGGETKEVVCGAPNVKVGIKVPYAPTGATLPNGMKLEPKKIRGILSEGMLCSEVELGLGVGKGGLMELSSSAVAGQLLVDYLKLKRDVILEVDNKSLTHRPDLWGHWGLAREFATQYKTDLKNPYDESWQKKIESYFTKELSPVAFEVEPSSSCLSYMGISIQNIKLTSTPSWIDQRLQAVGLRSINSLVDISNYVMVELGIPNHIFDQDKIKGLLKIKTVGSNIKFKTLDEVERDLEATDTIIADAEKPLVLAGIMGGASASVENSTKNIFVEVANWEAPLVRKTSVRLGLRSDSSQRYEKSLDSTQCYKTLLRLIELILQVHPEAKVVGQPQSFLKNQATPDLHLTLSHDRLISQLGKEISSNEILDIFTRLGFKPELKEQTYHVRIPSFRTTKDISCSADLVEEIGRVIGYDNIQSKSPLLEVRPIRLSATKIFHRKIQDFLTLEAKSYEVMTYPLVGDAILKKSHWPVMNENLVLVNALSNDSDRMRPSLVPSALQIMAENQKHFSKFSFFEIGRSYLNFTDEKNHLLLGFYSKSESCFLELINHVEKLLGFLQVPFDISAPDAKFPNLLIPKEWMGWHPHESLNVRIMGKFSGALTTVHPLLMKEFKARGFFSFCVIDLSMLENKIPKEKFKYIPISKFPSTTFDCSVEVAKDVMSAEPLKILSSKLKSASIKSTSILGVFPISDQLKSVTLRVVFESIEGTLTPELIKSLETQVVETLKNGGFPLRS